MLEGHQAHHHTPDETWLHREVASLQWKSSSVRKLLGVDTSEIVSFYIWKLHLVIEITPYPRTLQAFSKGKRLLTSFSKIVLPRSSKCRNRSALPERISNQRHTCLPKGYFIVGNCWRKLEGAHHSSLKSKILTNDLMPQ